MNSQEKQGYIDEINYQKKMIHNLIKYLICKNLCNHINNNIYISDYPCWKGYLQW